VSCKHRGVKGKRVKQIGQASSSTILGRGCGRRSHLFKFFKKKNMFMKSDMTRDVNTLRRCLDNGNQCESSYNPRTQTEKNKNITYEHYMDEETES
jgi:hypothetical protein